MRPVAVSLAVVAALLVAASAAASRAPTRPERAQIAAAILAYQHVYTCPTVHTCKVQISHVRVSLADQRFASADLSVPHVGGAFVLLRKRQGIWRVVDLGSADVGCNGTAPKAVRIDLGLTC